MIINLLLRMFFIIFLFMLKFIVLKSKEIYLISEVRFNSTQGMCHNLKKIAVIYPKPSSSDSRIVICEKGRCHLSLDVLIKNLLLYIFPLEESTNRRSHKDQNN